VHNVLLLALGAHLPGLFPKDFEHECTINCSVENIDLSILDDTESESDNETEVKQAMILDSKNKEGHEVSTYPDICCIGSLNYLLQTCKVECIMSCF
jgi:hypothetical protein